MHTKERNTERHNNNSEAIVKSSGLPEILHSDSGEQYRWTEALKEVISFSSYLKIQGHNLTKSGSGYLCRCPFHRDWAFTFVVNDDSARCSVCNWEGDIIEYVMKRHNLGFAESFRHISRIAWLCRKDAPVCIWNAMQVQDFPRVMLCQSEEDAITLMRGRYHIGNNCAVIAVESPYNVSEQLERLLAGKEVKLLMSEDEKLTDYYLDVVSECAKSVTLNK